MSDNDPLPPNKQHILANLERAMKELDIVPVDLTTQSPAYVRGFVHYREGKNIAIAMLAIGETLDYIAGWEQAKKRECAQVCAYVSCSLD